MNTAPQLVLTEDHRYLYGDRQLVSVTQALEILMDKMWFTPEKAELGTAVHLTTRYYDEGDLDEDGLDPLLAGYLAGWKAFRSDTGFTPDLIEHQVADLARGFAGTLDRACTDKQWRWCLDIKSGQPSDWHALQLAAYASCLPNSFSYRRMAVYLSADGKYAVREFPQKDYPSDIAVFLSAVNLTNWKRRHNGSAA